MNPKIKPITEENQEEDRIMFIWLSTRGGIVNAERLSRIYYSAEQKSIFASITGQWAPVLVEDNVDPKSADERMNYYFQGLGLQGSKKKKTIELELTVPDGGQSSLSKKDKMPKKPKGAKESELGRAANGGIRTNILCARYQRGENLIPEYTEESLYERVEHKEKSKVRYFGNEVDPRVEKYYDENEEVLKALGLGKGRDGYKHKCEGRGSVVGSLITAAKNGADINKLIRYKNIMASGKINKDKAYEKTALMMRDWLLNRSDTVTRDAEKIEEVLMVQRNLLHFLNEDVIQRLKATREFVWTNF